MIRVTGQSIFVSSYAFISIIEDSVKKFSDYFNKTMTMVIEPVDEESIRPDFTYRPANESMIQSDYGSAVYKFPLKYTMEFNEAVHLGDVSELAIHTYINSKFRLALAGTSMSHLVIEDIEFHIFDENGEERSLADILAEQRQEAIDQGMIVDKEKKRNVTVL